MQSRRAMPSMKSCARSRQRKCFVDWGYNQSGILVYLASVPEVCERCHATDYYSAEVNPLTVQFQIQILCSASIENRTLTPQEAARVKELEAVSKSFYDAAWARAQNKTAGRVLLPQAEEQASAAPINAHAPRHILVGSRLIKLVSTADNGLEVLAWSWSEHQLV